MSTKYGEIMEAVVSTDPYLQPLDSGNAFVRPLADERSITGLSSGDVIQMYTGAKVGDKIRKSALEYSIAACGTAGSLNIGDLGSATRYASGVTVSSAAVGRCAPTAGETDLYEVTADDLDEKGRYPILFTLTGSAITAIASGKAYLTGDIIG